MRASFGLYPSLRRHFKNMKEFADAGCMTPRHAQDCLRGRKQFTDQEKVAIQNYVAMKQEGMATADDFDLTYRIKGA